MAQSFFHRFLRLMAGLIFIWFFIWVFTPFLASRWGAMQHYMDVQEENNLHSGALYYTDVPVTPEAERNSRDTIRFLPKGPPP